MLLRLLLPRPLPMPTAPEERAEAWRRYQRVSARAASLQASVPHQHADEEMRDQYREPR